MILKVIYKLVINVKIYRQKWTIFNKSKKTFYQWKIDIVDPLTIILQENKYIVVAIDYFTKYLEARALTNTNAKKCCKFYLWGYYM